MSPQFDYYTLASILDLPAPFAVVKPQFGKPTKTEKRDTSKASNLSYNWYYGQQTMEAINGVTGTTPISGTSRLSKMAFFDKYRQLVNREGLRLPVTSYHDAKVASEVYNESKRILMKSLEESGFGKWIGKPVEHDTFA